MGTRRPEIDTRRESDHGSSGQEAGLALPELRSRFTEVRLFHEFGALLLDTWETA